MVGTFYSDMCTECFLGPVSRVRPPTMKLIGFLAVSPQVNLVINLAVDCHGKSFHQAQSYLSSYRTSLPFGQYEIVLLSNIGMCVNDLPLFYNNLINNTVEKLF